MRIWTTVPRGRLAASLVGILTLSLAGCTARVPLAFGERTGGNAALFGQFRAYDARTGRPLTFGAIARRCAAADAILLGEEHGDVVCNLLEAQLLHALALQPRPIALAMEFFESDTQGALDAYLQSRVAEPEFRRQARQGRGYLLAHRPLIEFGRAADIPVVAANAPRRLVRDYRKSGLDYGTWRAAQSAEDQRWLPTRSPHLSGPYEDRFLAMMSGHDDAPAGPPTTMPAAPGSAEGAAPATQPAATQPVAPPADTQPAVPVPSDEEMTRAPDSALASRPARDPQAPSPEPTASRPVFLPESQPADTQPAAEPAESAEPPEDDSPAAFYRAQLLWDDAMSESLANYRARNPGARVLLIVGSFHVAEDGGTTVKYRNRRPRDRVLTIVYRGTSDTALAFDPNDRQAADIVIYGVKPPPEEQRTGM